MKYLLGLKINRYDKLQESMQSLINNLSAFNWRELLVPPSPFHTHTLPRHVCFNCMRVMPLVVVWPRADESRTWSRRTVCAHCLVRYYPPRRLGLRQHVLRPLPDLHSAASVLRLLLDT